MSVISNISNIGNDSTFINDGEDVVRAADAAADKLVRLFNQLIAAL